MKFQLGNILEGKRTLSLVILLAMIIISGLFLPGITVNQDFNDYLPRGDSDLLFYQDFIDRMGDEDDIMLVALTREGGIFDQEFLVRADSFARALESIELIQKVSSLTNMKRSVYIPGKGVLSIPFLDINQPERFQRDSMKIMADERLQNLMISREAKTLIILILLQPEIDSKEANGLIKKIDETAEAHYINTYHKLGRVFWEVTYSRLANKELTRGFIISICLICFSMLLIFRSWRILLSTLLIYITSGVVVFGYMSLIGRELNAMSNLIPVILLIVSISDVIHIIEKFRLQSGYENRKKRITMTLNEVGLSVLLTSVTTSIGFLTLAISPVLSVRNFGIDMALGILITFSIAAILLPFFIQILKIDSIHSNKGLERLWRVICFWIYRAYRFRPAVIWIGVILLITLSIFFIFRIDQNNYIVSSMPENNTLTKDVTFFENEMGGARTFEIAVLPEQGSVINSPDILREISKVHKFLELQPDIGYVLSTATLYESMFGVIHPSKIPTLPSTEMEVLQVERVMREEGRVFGFTLIDSTRETGKISGRMRDLGRIEVGKVLSDIFLWIDNNIDTSKVNFIHTGSMLINDKVQQNTVNNLFTGLLIAIIIISILMALLFRDLWLVLITMLSNLIPILAVGGLMPLLHIQLRYGTSIIFAIGFVIAIDDTIHFIGNYRLYQLRNYPNNARIFLTIRNTGKAILITSFTLFLAFFTLIFSAFKDSFAIGALLSAMIILALLVDLLVVPVMLNSWIRKKNHPK